MTLNLDKQTTTKIFLLLKEGKFLSSNSPIKSEKKLFEYIEKHYDELYEYFSYIAIELKMKNNYCYFASVDNKELKLKTIKEFIDYLSFLYNVTPAFGTGYRFTILDIEEKTKDNITLSNKLKKLKTISGDTLRAKIVSLLNKLQKKSYIALEDEYLQRYVVLDSFEYLVEFFNSIEIGE